MNECFSLGLVKPLWIPSAGVRKCPVICACWHLARCAGVRGKGQDLLSMYALTDLVAEPFQKGLRFFAHSWQVFLRILASASVM